MIQHDSRVSKLVTCFFRTLHTIKVIKIATIFGPFLRDSKRLICCNPMDYMLSLKCLRHEMSPQMFMIAL